MSFLARLHPTRSTARRPISVLCMALYLIASMGIPLPVMATPRKGADKQRFPCENHNCGCQTAEQCWNACCCMSHKERLAWAKANGVKPPAWVILRRDEGTNESAGSKPKSCCGHCCHDSAPTEEDKCTDESRIARDNSGIKFVSFLASQRCRGASLQWMASGAVVVPAEMIEVHPDRAATYLPPPPAAQVEEPNFSPAVPPPRV